MSRPGFGDIEKSRNPAIRTLVTAITQVLNTVNHLGAKGPYLIMRIVASVTWEHRRKQFIKAHDVKEDNIYTKNAKWRDEKPLYYYPYVLDPAIYKADYKDAILRKRLDYEGECLDHIDIWLKNGKPHMMTSQPYFVSKDDLKKLIAHCDEHDIDFQIDAESFYYPGHTIRILFKKGSVNMKDAVAHECQDI